MLERPASARELEEAGGEVEQGAQAASDGPGQPKGTAPDGSEGLFKTWDQKAAEFEQLAAETEDTVGGTVSYRIATEHGAAPSVAVKVTLLPESRCFVSSPQLKDYMYG